LQAISAANDLPIKAGRILKIRREDTAAEEHSFVNKGKKIVVTSAKVA
jgi:hypothetical protein